MEAVQDIPPSPQSRVRTRDTANLMMELADLREALEASRRENEQLRRDAMHDPVTGLGSRLAFDRHLEHEWRRAQHQWTSLTLLAIDLDVGFGEAPDDVLRWVGRWLRDRIRAVDLAFRAGPRTVAILLPGTNRLGAEAELQRLERLGRYLRPTSLDVELRWGLAAAFDDAHTPLELLILADERALAPRVDSVAAPERPTVPHLVG